jgi:predicted transcriptional regulator
MATRHLGLSQRAVGDLLGISHPTVGKLARRWTQAASDRTPTPITAAG